MGVDHLNHRFVRLRTRVEGLRAPDAAAQGAGSQWVRDALQWLDSAQSELREAEGRLDVEHLITEVGAWRFRAFFDQVPMGFLITDLEGVILELNREAADILGETHHHLAGSLIHPYLVDHGRCLEEFSAGLGASDLAGEFHVRIRGADLAANAEADVALRPDRAGDSAELFWLLRRPADDSSASPARSGRCDDEPEYRDQVVPLYDLRSSLSTILNSALLLSMTAGDDPRARQLYEMIAKQVDYIARSIDGQPRPSEAAAFAREG